MAGETAFGAQLWLDDDGGDLTKIANALSVPPPALEGAAINVTDHDSTDDEYIASGAPPTVPAMAITIHRQAGTTKDELLYGAVNSKRAFAMVETKADGSLWGHTGDCIVVGYNPDGLDHDGKKTGTVTIQPTGPIARGAFTPPA